MPKMSLLTELWIVGLRGLQRCHAYGVSGKPPMPRGVPWHNAPPLVVGVSSRAFFGGGSAERRPAGVTLLVHCSFISLMIREATD